MDCEIVCLDRLMVSRWYCQTHGIQFRRKDRPEHCSHGSPIVENRTCFTCGWPADAAGKCTNPDKYKIPSKMPGHGTHPDPAVDRGKDTPVIEITKPDVKTFYMVSVDGGSAPSARHADREAARKEAARLSVKTGNRAYVLEMVEGCEPAGQVAWFDAHY